MSLSADDRATGGTLAGDQTLYYALSGAGFERGGEWIVVHGARHDSGGNEHE